MSLFSLMGIARDAMMAQSAGVELTGQNINNVNTPGYVRRNALLQNRAVRGGPGMGVAFMGAQRSFDRFAFGRVVIEAGKYGAANARSNHLATLESIVVGTERTALGDKVAEFLASFKDLTVKADDQTARTVLLHQAAEIADNFRSTSADLSTVESDILGQAQGVAEEVNSILVQIAKLNESITASRGAAPGADASLRDERDALIRQVGDRIGVKAVEDNTGAVTLISSGTVLVDARYATSLAVDIDASGKMRVQATRAGGSVVDISNGIESGSLGGLLEAHDSDVASVKLSLDQYAFDFANAVNAIHTTGVGLDGGTGRNFFTAPVAVQGAAYGLTVDAAIAGQPDRIGAASAAGDLPGGSDIALQLANLATQSIGAKGTPAETFASLVAEVGVLKSSADNERTFRQGTMNNADLLRESTSGVSLDEEMVNLTKFQRAFDASMRVLQTADELLAGLIRDL